MAGRAGSACDDGGAGGQPVRGKPEAAYHAFITADKETGARSRPRVHGGAGGAAARRPRQHTRSLAGGGPRRETVRPGG